VRMLKDPERTLGHRGALAAGASTHLPEETRPTGRRVTRAQDFGRVAVLLGGQSAERAVSLESGQAVLDALQRSGVNAHALDPQRDILERLRGSHFDRVFVVLHGRGGEDGIIQGALESAGLPYTGSGVLGSALAMDKTRSKLVWQASGIPTPAFRLLASAADAEAAAEALGLPLIVKPVHEGSSVGMSKVEDPRRMNEAWELARRVDTAVLAERWIDGAEYTAAILGDEVLPLIRVETPRAFYDYEAKYSDGVGTKYVIPCGLEAGEEHRFRACAWSAFQALGGSGWGRVDFLCDRQGAPWFIEVNTVPGMTSHSLVPMAAQAAGISFDELVWRVLETSVQ
jgi:D-alanine-D-alanine ligase